MYRELQLFDQAQFGVVTMDLEGRIAYANDWMSTLLGRPLAGAPFRDFVTDAESVRTLQEEWRKRLQGRSGQYIVTVDTPVRSVTVQVFGTPVLGDSGEVVASVVFVTRAPLDSVRDSLLAIDVSGSTPLDSLTQLCRVLEAHYPFDAFVVSMYDSDMEYSRVLYAYFKDRPHGARRWGKHWVRLTTAQRDWILESTAADRAIPDINEFLRLPEWQSLYDDPMAAATRSAGLNSVAGILIKEGTITAASVSLLSKRRGGYDEDFVRELHELPIDRPVLAVVNALRDGEIKFRHEVIRRLTRCHKIDEAANTIVKLLCRHYELARVALFSIEWADGCARIRSERVSGGIKRPSAAAEVPLHEGMIARVAQSGDPEYVEDISTDEYITRYLQDSRGSAFCWPVFYYRDGGQKLARWVFVAIDENPAAFSPGERKTLLDITSDIGGLLQRLTELHFMTSTFNATSDAIMVVDSRNEVRRANVAAAQLLGRADPREVTGDVSAFFVNRQEANALLRMPFASAEMQVGEADKENIPTMVSIRALPESIGGKVVALEDLRRIRRLEELSLLGRIASAVSAQIQTPLTLASSWVQRIGTAVDVPNALGKECGDDEQITVIRDLAKQTHAQLKRIQSCLDRITLFDSKGKVPARPIPVSLGEEIQDVIKDLPKADRERIQLNQPDSTVMVDFHPEPLRFVMDTLLAFFLSDLPWASRLVITTKRAGQAGLIECDIEQTIGPTTAEGSPDALRSEQGLVERALRKVLKAYGGQLRSLGAWHAQVELPLSREGFQCVS